MGGGGGKPGVGGSAIGIPSIRVPRKTTAFCAASQGVCGIGRHLHAAAVFTKVVSRRPRAKNKRIKRVSPGLGRQLPGYQGGISGCATHYPPIGSILVG